MVNEFGFNQGWRVNVHPRFVSDVTGDGRADIVGVGGSTVLVAVSLGNGSTLLAANPTAVARKASPNDVGPSGSSR